jgi:O-acetyl-ADP-ribose deacetylase (regulator of RNase III)
VTTARVVVGDITDLRGERPGAIVNAANTQLARGSGVCGAIFAAAGPDEMEAACRPLAPCSTGSAVATLGFGLARRGIAHVIHAVGPVWPGAGDPAAVQRADALLASAYRSALGLADALHVRCLAVPALSTGVYGYPADRAAGVATRTVAHHQGTL